MLEIVTVICVSLIVFLVYMMFRNEMVYRYRIKILESHKVDIEKITDKNIDKALKNMDKAHNRYRNLPSYGKMMNTFWVWPLSKFEEAKK